MRTVHYLPDLVPCPHLPTPGEPVTAAVMKRHGTDRGPEFYRGALQCAQSLWLQGLPAQAVLQLDRAFGADLPTGEAVLADHPWPYAAMAWLLRNHAADQFIGNPRRHFQHLATRMSGPRREVRVWRAWACWWLCRVAMPDLPADNVQLVRDRLVEPGEAEIGFQLDRWGHPGESGTWMEAAAQTGSS